MKNNNGITLVALVITIIVLLILAGVSISTVVGDNGIVSKATLASEITKNDAEDEKKQFEDVSDYINEEILEIDTLDPTLSHSGKVPDGAYYANAITGTFYDVMPNTVSDGDVYLFEDYVYFYGTFSFIDGSTATGWKVSLATNNLGITSYIPDYPVTDMNQTSYREILDYINNTPVIWLENTFNYCTSLIKAPALPKNTANIAEIFIGCTSLNDISNFKIPNTVKEMSGAFYDCINLTNASILNIPESVNNMGYTFKGCSSLKNVPTIPSSVNRITGIFQGCSTLTGNVKINGNPNKYKDCFLDTEKEITIIGSSNIKSELAATANNNNVTY